VVPVPVNIELGRIVEVAEKILARRDERDREVWADLADELEALAVVVRRVNKLYEDVLAGIQNNPPRSTRARDRAIEDARAFLRDDDIIGILTQLQGHVQAASQSHTINRRRFRGQEYRNLASALRGLERATEAYLNHLRQIQNHEVQTDSAGARLWNLADVLKALEGEEADIPLGELCEEAIRNRRTDLVYAISRLTGQARQHIKFR
jgi:hypothetical protein